MKTEGLPIYEVLSEVRDKLKTSSKLILEAPPGAGKSTALPLELLKEEWLENKKILMLEPRRLAARAVAARMASLLSEETGETVGYRVRFENRTGPRTRIEVLTEGMLTSLLHQDPELAGVGLVIFDEFHERSLHADLALTLCLEVQAVLREDLKILIMSATLDGETISSILHNAPVIKSRGRQFPVSLKYLGNDQATALPVRISGAIKTALKEQDGDVLVFLPGVGEINKVYDMLADSLTDCELVPLYGDLPIQQQQKAILPSGTGKRKIVLATSIAETSLTIEGIKTVIDSGLSRVPRFDARSGFTRLETIRVTQDTADQRAGRAGRLGPGTCYRLWSEGTHFQLVPHRSPEILEADLAPLVLDLALWGTARPDDLIWITKPPAGAYSLGRDLLQKLEALDAQYKITSGGREMARLPTHPRLAHLLSEAVKKNLGSLACDVAAVLEERDPLRSESADLTARIEILRKWRNKERVNADIQVLERIERLASNWRRLLKCGTDNSVPDPQKTGLLVAAAYPERIARQKENETRRYRLNTGNTVLLPQGDVLLEREKWLAVAQLDAGRAEGKVYLAAPLNPDDLTHLYNKRETISWDYQKGTLLAQTEIRLQDLIVKTIALEKPDENRKGKVLLDVISKTGLSIFEPGEEFRSFQNRVLSLSIWNKDYQLPDISEEALLADPSWALPYLSHVRRKEDFAKTDILQIIKGLFSWEQLNYIDTYAPVSIPVPSGFNVPLSYYADGKDPVLSVRLQEMFGLLETPLINNGRTKVLLHLLSPGYKPVQITHDLKSFWQNTYPEVRKELRVRYQKHHWPEDPWTAEAVRGVRKRTL